MRITKRRRILIAVSTFAGLLVVPAVVLCVTPRKLTIEVTGSDGQRITGFCEVDGKLHKLDGEIPVTFRYSGRNIAYAVKRVDGPESDEITVAVYAGDVKYGSIRSTGGAAGGLRVEGLGTLPTVGELPFGGAGNWGAGINFANRNLPVIVSPSTGSVPARNSPPEDLNSEHMTIWLAER